MGRTQNGTRHTVKYILFIISNTCRSSTSLVSRREAWEGFGGDLLTDSKCFLLKSRLASLTAACSLSSDKVVKLMELLVLPAMSCSSENGKSFSITMAPGVWTQVARFLALAGMPSLNKSCDFQDKKYDKVCMKMLAYFEAKTFIFRYKGLQLLQIRVCVKQLCYPGHC